MPWCITCIVMKQFGRVSRYNSRGEHFQFLLGGKPIWWEKGLLGGAQGVEDTMSTT